MRDSSLKAALRRDGFCFTDADWTRALLEDGGDISDWAAFAASWNDLEPDRYLAEVGRIRKRRHAVFHAAQGAPILRQPHQPHYQDREYNRLQGGIERWFSPMSPEAGDSASLCTILQRSREIFSSLAPQIDEWHIEVHQFRIEASSSAPGEPTPEGVHRDGVDYVLVVLIERRNIRSGTTTIHDAEATEVGSFTLTAPFDSAWVDDKRRFHGVTPVEAQDPNAPAYRDVLVVTYRRQ